MNKEIIKKRILEFRDKHGRIPNTFDFNKENGLPSARYIQRHFDGLVNLRKELDLSQADIDLRSNSKTAIAIKKSIKSSEKEIKKIKLLLIEKFGKINVHEEVRYADNNSCRSDFVVYYKDDLNFIIDTFYASSETSLQRLINHKIKKFKTSTISCLITIVSTNEKLDNDLYKFEGRRKIPLDPMVSIITKEQLIELINSMSYN